MSSGADSLTRLNFSLERNSNGMTNGVCSLDESALGRAGSLARLNFLLGGRQWFDYRCLLARSPKFLAGGTSMV